LCDDSRLRPNPNPVGNFIHERLIKAVDTRVERWRENSVPKRMIEGETWEKRKWMERMAGDWGYGRMESV
jgi:hypothetical protein